MDAPADTFGKRLRALREGAKETQVQLAACVPTADGKTVNSGTVSRWERDDGMPHALQLVELARHYAVTTDYLLLGVLPQKGEPVSLPEFDRFLATEIGRIAEQRGYTRALISLRYPYPPTVKLYAALVMAMMTAAEDK